ncbi:MAG TPA: hypothetical protein VJT31_37380 [Rugosimonospora sp.]|nr:hypothetical protein [Rugosimonospora sp.]
MTRTHRALLATLAVIVFSLVAVSMIAAGSAVAASFAATSTVTAVVALPPDPNAPAPHCSGC